MMTTLTADLIEQIEEHLVEALPKLLVRNPEIAVTIEGILAQHFPRRDEFARLLDEMTATRQEVAETRQEVAETRQDLSQLRQEMNQRFEQVEQRFGKVERDITGMKGDILQLKRGVTQLKHGQDMLLKRVEGESDWMHMTIGDVRNERGKSLEEFFAAGLRYGLQDPNIVEETIRLRQPLVDREGHVFRKGVETEVDVVALSDELIVFEVKATLKVSEVTYFALKVELFAIQNPDMKVRGVLVSLGAPEDTRQRGEELGIQVLG